MSEHPGVDGVAAWSEQRDRSGENDNRKDDVVECEEDPKSNGADTDNNRNDRRQKADE